MYAVNSAVRVIALAKRFNAVLTEFLCAQPARNFH